jgi:hypothetical protein
MQPTFTDEQAQAAIEIASFLTPTLVRLIRVGLITIVSHQAEGQELKAEKLIESIQLTDPASLVLFAMGIEDN